MNTLILLIISAAVMMILTLRSYITTSSKHGFAEAAGLGAGDLLRSEAAWVRTKIEHLYSRVRPLFARLLIRTGQFLYRTGAGMYGEFSRKVFGRIDIEKGPAASFFVKHIREFKAELEKDERLSN
jgi:hypothetical protein